MSSNTVAEFAAELGKPTSVLLEQLSSAGVHKRAGNDMLTETDKQKLLAHLQASHGVAQGDRPHQPPGSVLVVFVTASPR